MLIANSLHLHWTDPQLHLPVLVKSEAHGEDAADEDPSMKEEPKAVTWLRLHPVSQCHWWKAKLAVDFLLG